MYYVQAQENRALLQIALLVAEQSLRKLALDAEADDVATQLQVLCMERADSGCG